MSAYRFLDDSKIPNAKFLFRSRAVLSSTNDFDTVIFIACSKTFWLITPNNDIETLMLLL